MKIDFVKFASWIAAGLFVIAAGGCTELDSAGPHFTTPPRFYNEKGIAQSVQAVAICYNSTLDTPKQITELVRTACTNPRLLRSDYLGECGMVQPVRATYLCDSVDKNIASVPPFPPEFKHGADIGFKTKTGN